MNLILYKFWVQVGFTFFILCFSSFQLWREVEGKEFYTGSMMAVVTWWFESPGKQQREE